MLTFLLAPIAVLIAWEAYVRRYRPSPSSPVFDYAVATVATTVTPHLRAHVRPDTHFFITGYDGFSVGAAYYNWRKQMIELADASRGFTYFLQDPTSAALGSLSCLERDRPGKFKVFVLDSSAAIPSADRALLERLKTEHFLVSLNPKMIWLEANHPAQSTKAYGCQFIGPSLAEHDSRHRELLQLFQRLVSYSIPLQAYRERFKSTAEHGAVQATSVPQEMFSHENLMTV